MGRRVVWMALVILGGAALAGCAKKPPAPAPAGPTEPAPDLSELTGALEKAGGGSLKTYGPADMYEAVDGEADLFLSYDCRGLAVADYEVEGASIKAEVFDQAEPLNAFGVYGQLSKGAEPVAVGAQGGLMAQEAVFFWKARWFVRVSATSAKRPPPAALVELAQRIAGGLTGSSSLPAWTKALPPADGEKVRTQYVARNVLGHGFLSRAMIGEYGACRVVLVRGDDEPQAEDAYGRLQAFYQGAENQDLQGVGAEAFVGADSQGQAVSAVRSGRYLVLAVGRCDAMRPLLSETLRRADGAEG